MVDVLMRIMVDLEFKDFEEAVLVSEMCSSVFFHRGHAIFTILYQKYSVGLKQGRYRCEY